MFYHPDTDTTLLNSYFYLVTNFINPIGLTVSTW